MKDYYNLYIQLSLQQCIQSDYSDKEKVKKHNAAAKKIAHLQEEMKEIDCADILDKLLSYEDNRVKLNASSFCLQTNIHREKAMYVLESIVNTSNDETLRFSAQMLLQRIQKTD